VIVRQQLRCQTCEEPFVARLGIGSGRLPLIFQCPHCEVALRATLEPDPKTLDLNFKSEDVVPEEDAAEEDEIQSVTVYADVPVPKAMQGIPAKNANLSPFILFAQVIGHGELGELMGRVEAMRSFRTNVFPKLRRAASLIRTGDFTALAAAVDRLPGVADIEGLCEQHPLYQFGRYVETLYLPFASLEPRIAAIGELGTLLIAAEHHEGGPEHLETLNNRADWIEHRRRIYESVVNALSLVETLMPAMAWEQVDEKKYKVDDYLVMRDDFDQLKGVYQDLFELGSRSLAYVGSILNLVVRGDPRQFSNGKRCSLTKALRATANQREFILDELPQAKLLYDQIDRHTRNDIGHRLVSFDFATQTLVDDKGRQTNYLLFLEDFLGAVRFSSYLLGVAEKVTLHAIQADVPQRRAAGLPISTT
jgi:hypothetical protein